LIRYGWFSFAAGSHIMKIAHIETFTNEFVCFVKVTTDSGESGWGQVAPYHADITAQVLHRQVAPYALGQSALDIDELVDIIPGTGAQVSRLLSAPRAGRA
jgi:L-alanine-DL-glutamate epimerase-like enolase superfamily enzyme